MNRRGRETRAERGRDWFLISFLLTLSTLIHIWHLCHTEVTSRDSIGFERYAWELQHKEWQETFRTNVHHPLYPVTVLAVSVPLRWFHPGSDIVVMQLSAQLASGLAAILLVVPMFFLGKELFDRRVGFWATALFQCFPVAGRVLSDALSEPLFLLLSVAGLLLAVRALRSGSWVHFAFCGLCSGLAYLTRPEGIFLGVSVALVLLGRQLTPAGRGAWRKTWTHLACSTAAALMVAGPYVLIIGGISNKTTAKEILQTARQETVSVRGQETHAQRAELVQGPLIASMLATWWPDGQNSDFQARLWWSLYALASEVVKGFFYVAWLPAFLGLYWFRERLYAVPGVWVMLVLCLLQSLALLRVAMVAGYVSDRHVLIIVLCGLYWAVAAIFALGHMWTRTRSASEGGQSLISRATFGHRWPLGLVLILGAIALAKTLAPLHTNRAGHHAVGLWLAEHVASGDEIIDPFCWAAHYAGRTFVMPSDQPVDQSVCRHRYIVHECRPDHRERYRAPSIPEADIRAAGGKVVYHWPSDGPRNQAKILLYDIPLNHK
jgi:hypothetical protein